MDKTLLYILDVFAEEKFAGNQLAVFRHCGDFSTEKMQKIAREMNFSETTFIVSETPRNDGYDVRIFTPGTELPFAGHPTLGTSFIIQQKIIQKPLESIKLNLKVGQIPVRFIYQDGQPDIIWMKQNQPQFGKKYSINLIAEILNLDMTDFDDRFPICEVSTGMVTVIAPLKTMAAVKKARLNLDKYSQFMKANGEMPIFFFSPETYARDNDLNCRFFAECFGIDEDPATGSAAGCLAGYLCQYKYFGQDNIDIKIEQGYEIMRPSRLYLRAGVTNDKFDIFVGGKVHLIAQGELF